MEERGRPKKDNETFVNMASVVTNPKMVNNQTKMPNIESSRLGNPNTLLNKNPMLTETALNRGDDEKEDVNDGSITEIRRKIDQIEP
jgi:hypothetical protein